MVANQLTNLLKKIATMGSRLLIAPQHFANITFQFCFLTGMAFSCYD
jgi:hypothetical protein